MTIATQLVTNNVKLRGRICWDWDVHNKICGPSGTPELSELPQKNTRRKKK